jgi:predicted AlkP superfamily pyrophosphatase or phosphodiesterase
MINICLDVPRIVAERYGSDSVEYEDMLYSLDASLEEFLTFLYAQLKSREEAVVVLTSDGGMSPTQSENSDSMRFNARQFEVIINAFLSARYGQDAWVLGYADGSLYLNHDVIYKHKLSVEEVQNEAATFALQYRGVATAVTATAMRSAQFLRGTTALLQNGYNPRRSGDVLLAFEVERIELDTRRVAMSGSVYNYDRHIPFVISGGGVVPQRVTSRVKNEQIAPTLAAFMGVERPQCADVEVLNIERKK